MKIRHTTRMFAATCTLTAALAAAPLQADPPAKDPASWAAAVWQAAQRGDEAAILDTLAKRPADTLPEQLEKSIQSFLDNIDKREQTRDERIAEARQKLDELLEQGEEASIREAIREAVSLQLLLPEKSETELLNDERIALLIEKAQRTAREAEQNHDWLAASELYHRLNVLLERDGRFADDIRRSGQRLAMIRLYAPKQWWQLRNDRRIADGEDELPPYNPMGDDFKQKLAGIGIEMIGQAVERAARFNLRETSMDELLLGGLDAVRTLATTPDLYSAFPGLNDEAARKDFLEFLELEKDRIRNLRSNASSRDLSETLYRLRGRNNRSVNILEAALLHEFGNGAMSVLDEFSGMIWPDEIRRFERSTRGAFVGVGIQIEMDEQGRIRVVTPLEGTPAQRAGVRADDVIVRVNGQSAEGFSLDQAVDVITGPENTKVTLTVERLDPEGERTTEDFNITRARIPLHSVRGWRRAGVGEDDWDWFIDPESHVGYIRLSNFTEQTADEFDRAVDQMREQGLAGLILDLRFNPGGLLDQAVEVTSRFVDGAQAGLFFPDRPDARRGRREPPGVVVSTRGKGGLPASRPETIRAGVDRVPNIPVVILINEGSASASEIVSGAIQDYASKGALQALVLGTRSFGKASVQNVWYLNTPAAPPAAIKLTTQQYVLPGGRLIDRAPGRDDHGVDPDLTITMLPDQITEAITYRRRADVVTVGDNGQPEFGEESLDPYRIIEQGTDLQLQTALVLLQAQILAGPAAHAELKQPEPANRVP